MFKSLIMKKLFSSLLVILLSSCSTNDNIYNRFSKPTLLEEIHYSSDSDNKIDFEPIDKFSSNLAKQLINNSDNSLFSPLSLYLLDSMLGDINPNEKLLNNLGISSVKELELINNAILNKHKDNVSNSFWFDDNLDVYKDPIQKLAVNYYASSYQMDFANEDNLNYLSSWVNQKTNNLLDVNNKDLGIDTDTIMAIINTLYVIDNWQSPLNVKKGIKFKGVNGDEETDFLTKTTPFYTSSDEYEAVRLSTRNNHLDIYLPHEEFDLTSVVSDSLLKEAIPLKEGLNVDVFFPRFAIKNSLDLTTINRDITDIEFISGLSPTVIQVNKVMQNNYLSVDENGLEATTASSFSGYGAAPMDDNTFELIINRPFLFVLRDDLDLPLYVGSVVRL